DLLRPHEQQCRRERADQQCSEPGVLYLYADLSWRAGVSGDVLVTAISGGLKAEPQRVLAGPAASEKSDVRLDGGSSSDARCHDLRVLSVQPRIAAPALSRYQFQPGQFAGHLRA